MLAIADELGVSADQVAIAWAGTHGAIPMIGPRSLKQLASNLGAVAVSFSAEQLHRLDSVSGLDPASPTRTVRSWAGEEYAGRIVA